jgi:hypothetical protein
MIKRAVDGFALTANLRKTRGTSLPIACICDLSTHLRGVITQGIAIAPQWRWDAATRCDGRSNEAPGKHRVCHRC